MSKDFYKGRLSINREKSSPYWMVSFQGPDGKMRRRSTKVPVAGGIFFALHLLWWERCRVFWRAVWRGISAIVRWTLWPVCYLYRKAQMRWKAWKEQRKERRIIAEFDRLHPELKDKYTDYGKLQFMRLAQDPTFQRINKLRHASSCLLTPSVCVLPYKKACHTVTVTVT